MKPRRLLPAFSLILAGLMSGAAAQSIHSPKPAAAPERWNPFIGEYGSDQQIVYVLEKEGRLQLLSNKNDYCPASETPNNRFRFPKGGCRAGQELEFKRGRGGKVLAVKLDGATLPRRRIGPEEGAAQLRIQPLRPVAGLIPEALAARPPTESGSFSPPDLVELTTLDPSIRLEIRYATTENFLGSVFYSQARAFLQRPAAEAMVRVHGRLAGQGFGLQVFDAYRPWYVTKVFWEATPPEKRVFVADPAKGSRHNRGCAVDLTLYDLATGKAVDMGGTYDETTDRSYPYYPGGTSLQRWHRQVLRVAMEAEGFTVYEAEWWHFDYRDWRQYPITNLTFDRLRP